jgi:integrase
MTGTNKRAVSDIPIYIDDRLWTELYEIVNREGWNYKTNREAFILRDRALTCSLILSGLRISEALRLKRLQFRVYEDKILLANAETLKHGNLREKIIFPKKGSLAPFTSIFEEWLKNVPSEDSYVFPSGFPFSNREVFRWDKHLSSHRAYDIISTVTGKFPHWFRGVNENVYGRMVFKNSAWKLKEFMGLKRLDSTTPYINSAWEDDEKRIYTV